MYAPHYFNITLQERKQLMRRYLGFLIMVCVCLLFAVPNWCVELTSSKYANVFIEKEKVIIKASSDAAVSIIDENNKEIISRKGSGKLDFGKMLPGFYEAISGDTRLPFVVLIDPARRVKGDSKAVADNAMSWLVSPADFTDMARLLKLSGISWVRERLSWGEVEKEKGKYTWGKYQDSANALHKQGIKVYQISHDNPAWSRKDGVTNAAPDDLRDVFNYAKAAAQQFKGKVFAWEFWNEPDISFFKYPSGECAALQKAAYLGIKSANKDMKVLGPSMAMTGVFEWALVDNDLGSYMDVWNYHVYANPEEYMTRADHFREVLAKHSINLPMWVTEAGDPYAEGPDGVLSGGALTHQARFVSRAISYGIAAGVEKHFYFVFPYYREGTRGWGFFGPGNKYPYPGLAAISNATYALGQAKYLGTVQSPAAGDRIMAFDRGNGTTCITAWQVTDKHAEMALPINWSQVKDARDYLGRPMKPGTGRVKLTLGDGAAFFILKSKGLKLTYIKPAVKTWTAEENNKPSILNIVPRLVYSMPITNPGAMKAEDGYTVNTNNKVELTAEVYNFGNRQFDGEIQVSSPGSSAPVLPSLIKCSVAPGAVFRVPISVGPRLGGDSYEVQAQVCCGNSRSSKAIVKLLPDPDLMPQISGYNIQSNSPEDWEPNISPPGTMKIESDPVSGVKFAFNFAPNTDKWAYPHTVKRETMDLSGYNAIQFEYKTDSQDRGDVRVMLVEESEAFYVSATVICSAEWRPATVLFKSMYPFQPDQKLDLDKIARIRIGTNSLTDTFTLSVRNIRAVKL